MKVMVREGWTNAEGKKGDPRLQFIAIQYLQDVLTTFAKKLIIQFNVAELQEQLISNLSELFNGNKGDNQVTFEVMELEKVKKQVEIAATAPVKETAGDVDDDEFAEVTIAENIVTEVEEVQVLTKLVMPSRKLKIKISTELLHELDKLQVNFKLN